MKFNLILLIIFSGLVLFTYFWEELDFKQDYIDQKTTQLIGKSLLSVEGITLKKSKLLKINNQWIIGEFKQPAEKQIVEIILKSLSGLEIIKKIDTNGDDDSEYFKYHDHTFSLLYSGHEEFYRLGDISEVTGAFYLQKFSGGKKELFLVRDSNNYEGLYKNEVEAEYQKYNKFKDLLRLRPVDYLSNQILDNEILLSLKKIEFKSSQENEFEINTQGTIPKALNGIRYKALGDVIVSKNNLGKILGYYTGELESLGDLIKTIEVKAKEDLTLRVYKEYKGESGFFIFDTYKDAIFKVETLKGTLFDINVHNFWVKKFNLIKSIREKQSISFNLKTDKKEYKVEVRDTNKFKYILDNREPTSTEIEALNFAFNVLLNNKGFEEATFISQYNGFPPETNRKLTAPTNSIYFTLDFGEYKYEFRLRKSVVDVFDHVNKIRFSFISPKMDKVTAKIKDIFTRI